MSRFKRTRRLRIGLVLGLAALLLATAPGALGTAPKPPPKPPGKKGGGSGDDQYAPPQASYSNTARARRIGLCKKAVAKKLAPQLKKCKNAKCRARAQHQNALARQQCNKLRPRR